MAFDCYCGAAPRGSIKWWPPDYLRGPTPAEVDAWFPPRDTAIRGTAILDFCRSARAPLAEVNRALRDAEVRFFGLGTRIIAVCSYEGEWRSADGANRGSSLLDLGAWRWSCRFGQAGHRIARLCGIRAVPTVAP
jgi:hypothetical protein